MAEIDANLVSVEKVPEEYRSVFCEFPYFNKIQSTVFDHILHSDKPFVVAAPTGSGKTVIFELAIIRLLKQLNSFANPILSSTKIIYVAPMKALCEERYIDWYKKFNIFGLKCVAITGDSNETFMEMLDYNIIITTPEKWDTITRKWRDHKKLVSSIKLFLIDEIHLINEEKRGATLETIVCRMKTIESFQYEASSSSLMNGIRFVAASATIPNVEDIAQWIGSSNNAAISYSFSEDMRPVKLNKIVYGYQTHDKNPFKFDIMLNYKLQPVILQYAEGKPTLIFCSTRKSVEMTSKYISQNITTCMSLDQKSVLSNSARIISDNKCKEFLIHGVGYHHAGMLLETRKIVENLFRNGDLPILVTTSTLAIGVNLPAHLVIIKSTKCFTNGEYRDYSEGTVLQMIGRAGRPQFDTSATAVILTTIKDKAKYENMVGRGQMIESNLHRHLIEHLNADICLKTVTDLGIALQWISSTFLYIRAKKSPRYYGLPPNLTDKELDNKLMEMCQIDINRLASHGMITMDQMASISPTRLGYLMADHYIAFDTMKVFINIKGDEVLPQMLIILSKCQEFQDLYIRTSDKKSLNLLNKNKSTECIRFPFNARINSAEMKVNCLIQAVFGCLHINDHSLLNDATKIIRAGQRVTSCLTKYLETRSNSCFMALLNSYILSKCFQAKIWENSKFVSRQLSDIGTVRSKLLVDAEKVTFKSILDSNPRDLERIMKKKSPFGDNIRSQVMSFPFYKMSLIKKSTEQVIELKITVTNAELLHESSEINDVMILIVGDDQNNILLHEKYTHEYMKDSITIERDIEYNEDTIQINANFICENKVGLDCVAIFEINPKDIQKESSVSKTAKTATLVKKGATKQKKNAPVQKTMNNFFPVVKTKPQINTQKTLECLDKENIPDNVNNSTDAENFNIKTIATCSFQTIEISKNTEEISKIKSMKSANHEDLFSDINKIILEHGKCTEKEKAGEGIPLPEALVSKPSTSRISSSKPNTSKLRSSFSQVDSIDIIEMLNKKFLERAKSKAKVQEPKSKPPIGNSSIKEFLSKYEASKNKLTNKRVTPVEKFENSIYKEISDEVPKKKVLTNEGTAVGVPDSTVSNNKFHLDFEIIEPEENTNRNRYSRNITWKSPLIESPKSKYSPRQGVWLNFSQNLKKTDSSPAITNTNKRNSQSFKLNLKTHKTNPVSPIANKELEESDLCSSQNSFVCPNLLAFFRQEAQKNTENLNLSANSSRSFYEETVASDYYNSLKDMSSPIKQNKKDIVTENLAVQTNFDEMLEDDNEAFLQDVLLDLPTDNVEKRPCEISTDNEQYFDQYSTPKRSSSSFRLSTKSFDFCVDDSKYEKELPPPDEVNINYDVTPRVENESFMSYPNTQHNYQLPQRHFDFTNSPPRIQFDQMIRNYYEPNQTSHYFDRPLQRELIHNSQPHRSLQNISSQFEEPRYYNQRPSVPLLNESANQFYNQLPRHQNYLPQLNNEFRTPYPRQEFISQNLYHPLAETVAPIINNRRYATQDDFWQRQALIDNAQQYRNQRPRTQPINGSSQAFGSFEQQMLHNQSFVSNAMQNQSFASNSMHNQQRMNDFHGQMSSQYRMPEPNTLDDSFSVYSEAAQMPPTYRNRCLNPSNRSRSHNPTYSRISGDQNYRRMEQGSQLMDALNPPEEREGKRLIFSQFMNSLN